MNINFCLVDENRVFVSSRVGTEYSTWSHNEKRGVDSPLQKHDMFYQWNGLGWDELTEYPHPAPLPEPIPSSITPRQARLKLLETDLLDNLEAVITTNRAWQIEWEYATEVKRDSPLIDAVASEASLTVEQIDQMFIEASKL
jgi:hypothetical protein